MAQTTKYNGTLYKHSKLTEEIIGAFFCVNTCTALRSVQCRCQRPK